MIRVSIIISLLTLYASKCEFVKLYQSDTELSAECKKLISDEELRYGKVILESWWGCTAKPTVNSLKLTCFSRRHECCVMWTVVQWVRQKVNESCGEGMMYSYIGEQKEKLNDCGIQYIYGSAKCVEFENQSPNIKQCDQKLESTEKKCHTSAEQDWKCTSDCDHFKQFCCSRWQHWDCMRSEAKQVCNEYAFNEVVTRFIAQKIKGLEETNCTEYTYGSNQCQKSTDIPVTTKKSKGSSNALIIVGVILLLLIIIIGAILLIWFCLFKKPKNEKTGEEKRVEESGDGEKRGEELVTMRSKSLGLSDKESDSAKITESDKPFEKK